MHVRVVAVLALVFVLLGPLFAPPPARAQARTPVAVEVQLAHLINAERQRAGVPPLRVDVRMVARARRWAAEMARRGSISHHPDVRADTPAGATAWGENVGKSADADPAAALHASFMASPGHRHVVLNPNYTDLGVGVARAGGSTYVTERFSGGAPAAVSAGVEAIADLARRTFGAGGAAHAVLVRDDAFPDGLAAAPLAGMTGAVLFTPPGPVVHPTVRHTLEQILAPGRTVYVLGGTNALPSAVDQELSGARWAVHRVSAANRVESAAAVARVLAARTGAPDTVLLATAGAWPDAVAASAFGARTNSPVVLTNPDELPPATARVLRDLSPNRVVALGGPSAISDAIVAETGAVRVAAANRQGTAAEIAREVWGRRTAPSTRYWTVAPDDADGWVWATGGAPVAARLDAPLLLTGDTVDDTVTAYLRELDYSGDEHADLAIVGPVPARTASHLAALVE